MTDGGDARHVLAQAMGRAAPPAARPVAEEFGMPLLTQLLSEPSLENAQLALSSVAVWRALALLAALIMLPWIAHLLFHARRRYLGFQSAPVPLDYKAQRKLAKGAAPR